MSISVADASGRRDSLSAPADGAPFRVELPSVAPVTPVTPVTTVSATMPVAPVAPVARMSFADLPSIDFGGPVGPSRPSRPTGTATGPRLVVLYDRDCGICTATARQLRRWDRRCALEMLPLQDASASGRPLLAAVVRDRRVSALLHVVDVRSGAIYAGGDAAIAIGEALPGGRLVRLVGRIPPARWAIGIGYGLIANNRHRIGRWLRLEGPVCALPQ